MQTKICTKCKKRKKLSDFYKNKTFKDGCTYDCKSCANKRIKQWVINNPKKVFSYHKKWYEKTKKIRRQKAKEYRTIHPLKAKQTKTKCYLKHRKERLEYNKIYQKLNRKKRQQYQNLKRKTDINFKLACNLRSRIRWALKRNTKTKSTRELLGCSIEKLKQYLENKFINNMNWNNYGQGWHGKGKKE